MDSGVLEEPYSDDNARREAILRRVLEDFQGDISQVSGDNKKLAELGMMVNQGLVSVLVKLEHWPALAKRLDDEKGVEFSHMSMGKGRIRMVVVDDMVQVRMRMGSCISKLTNDNKFIPGSCPIVTDVNN